MIPQIWMLKLAGIAVVILAAYGVYWSVGNEGYLRGKEEVYRLWADANEAAEDQQAARTKTAQEKHDADQKTIARLAADARRLRVSFPVCSASTSGEGADGGSGVLPNRVDEEFAVFQEEVGRLVERADQLNADTIRQNASLP